jgi:hypothetical protein
MHTTRFGVRLIRDISKQSKNKKISFIKQRGYLATVSGVIVTPAKACHILLRNSGGMPNIYALVSICSAPSPFPSTSHSNVPNLMKSSTPCCSGVKAILFLLET